MAKPPKGIHTTSRGLLKRFAERGLVTVEYADGTAEDLGVKLVCRQHDYWGSPELARAVEQSLNACESPALRLIQELSRRWPLEDGERALLSEFVAVHVVRAPAFKSFVRQLGEEAIRSEEERRPSRPAHLAAAVAAVRDPTSHVNAVLHSVGRIASLFSCMHWSLVEFESDLSTGDQPVVVLPNASGNWTPASSVPFSGLTNTIEVRFTLDPHTLLLMSWQDDPDAPEPIPGSYDEACSVNCALRAQAMEQWVHRPGGKPPRLKPPILTPHVYPIAPQLSPGFTPESAAGSERRGEAERILAEMIETNAPRDRIRWVKTAA